MLAWLCYDGVLCRWYESFILHRCFYGVMKYRRPAVLPLLLTILCQCRGRSIARFNFIFDLFLHELSNWFRIGWQTPFFVVIAKSSTLSRTVRIVVGDTVESLLFESTSRQIGRLFDPEFELSPIPTSIKSISNFRGIGLDSMSHENPSWVSVF